MHSFIIQVYYVFHPKYNFLIYHSYLEYIFSPSEKFKKRKHWVQMIATKAQHMELLYTERL